MMTTEFAIGFATAVAIAFALAAVILALRSNSARPNDSLILIQHQLEELRGELSSHQRDQKAQLNQAHQMVGAQLDTASRQFATVHQKLGSLEQATARMLEVGQTVAGIEDLLKAPKLRGILGEFLLAELLRQGLPEGLFSLQHPLRNGEKVDAVVRLGDRLLPVDSKFPLENFRRASESNTDGEREKYERVFARDFRKHVDDIASKYIVPEMGTLPLAFLYVPAESVFQQGVLGNWELATYAMKRRVVPAGPLSFFAYIQSVLLGVRAISVPEHAHELARQVEQMGVDWEAVDTEFRKLRRHMDFARAALDSVGQKSSQLAATLARSRSAFDMRPAAATKSDGPTQ